MAYKLHIKQEEFLNKIINLLENNDLKWLKNWVGGYSKNYITKKEYKGVNALICHLNNIEQGFKSNYYLTFLQIKKLKGYLNKGSKGIPIFYYDIKKYKKEVIKEGIKTEEEKTHPILKVYSVFNVEQTNIKIEEEIKVLNPLEKCEDIIKGYTDKPTIKELKQDKACYNPKEDLIIIPTKEQFKTIEDYYSTLYHELSHSTGHEKRLNREGLKVVNFGSGVYSKEEVIAELSNCFLCGASGIENNTLNNNVAYIKGWLDCMKQDKTFLFKVIREGQKSADYILKGCMPIEEGLK